MSHAETGICTESKDSGGAIDLRRCKEKINVLGSTEEIKRSKIGAKRKNEKSHPSMLVYSAYELWGMKGSGKRVMKQLGKTKLATTIETVPFYRFARIASTA